ncbi:MAG: tetratricopeptide repeat protein [Paramuribaculum sp.]|nr:tetratricopeptide repeat protein [Paramuribaculum sp.]
MKRTLLFIITALFISIAIAVIAAGCSRISRNPDLLRADALTDTDPYAALRLLDSLPYDSLSEADRHFHDLVSVKAADKAYITHTSDSLILDAAAYFKSTDRQPEALYYAGRVYSDLGDYPTALRYFQNALEQLPEDTPQTDLRNRVLSQTGRLMTQLRLYSQAIPYLKQSLEISLQSGDSTHIAYAHQLLGSTYLYNKDYINSDIHFTKAQDIASHQSDSIKAYIQGFLAANALLCKDIDKARDLIYTVPEKVFRQDRDYFTATAAEIYYKSEQYDSAYYYAQQITGSRNPSYRITAYNILLKPEIRGFYTTDTAYSFFNHYLSALEQNNNRSDAESVIFQNSIYNYNLHVRESLRLSENKKHLYLLLATSLAIILALIISTYTMLRLIEGKKTQLKQALASISDLNRIIDSLKLEQSRENIPLESGTITYDDPSIKEMKREISLEILKLKQRMSLIKEVPNSAIGSEGYNIVSELLRKNRVLNDESDLWQDITTALDHTCPHFRYNLSIIAKRPLSRQEYHLVVLIRLGFSTTEISHVINRSKSATSYRRQKICNVVFSGLITPQELDLAIRLL